MFLIKDYLKKILFITIFLSVSNIAAIAQNIQLLNNQNKPITGATVEVKNNNNEIYRLVSNKKGAIKLTSLINNTILIRHISYQTLDTIIPLLEKENIIVLKDSKNHLNEIVVTGQINMQGISKSVNDFILISNQEIKQKASNNLQDILSDYALFDINNDPSLGSSLSIQGIQGNNINILIDGIPILGRKGSQIDLSQINLSNIDKIEILKGPASVAYGSNSTGGVINLISKENSNNQLKINTYYEDIDAYQLNIDINKKIKKNNININLGVYDFLGYSKDSLRSQEWKPKEQYFGGISLKRKLKKYNIIIKSDFFREKIIELGNENFPPFDGTAIDNNYFTNRHTSHIKMEHLGDFHNWKGVLSFASTKFAKKQYDTNIITNQSIQTNDTLYNNQDIFQSIYGRWEYSRDKWENFKFQFGYEYKYEKINGPRIQNNTSNFYEQAFFTQLNLKLNNKIENQIGLRIPYHSVYNAPFTPSIHFKYNASHNIQIRSSYARGFRAPSIKELFLEFIDINHNIVGNDELKAEKSHALQTSIRFDPIHEENRYLSFNIEGYFQYLYNKISIAQIGVTNAYTYYNMSEVQNYGLNSRIEGYFNNNKIALMWNIYNMENNLYTYNSPKQNISVTYSYKYSKWNCGINLNWKLKSKNEYNRIDSNSEIITYIQEEYQLLNVSIFKNLPKINTSVSLGVKNLFDVKSINNLDPTSIHSGTENMISWGRTYFIQLTCRPLYN